MAEHIKREAAVKELTRIAMGVSETKARAVAKCINAVELLPAADVVERKRGRWEYLQDDEWRCSNCHTIFSTEGRWEPMTAKFCEECGADMRRNEDGKHG